MVKYYMTDDSRIHEKERIEVHFYNGIKYIKLSGILEKVDYLRKKIILDEIRINFCDGISNPSERPPVVTYTAPALISGLSLISALIPFSCKEDTGFKVQSSINDRYSFEN